MIYPIATRKITAFSFAMAWLAFVGQGTGYGQGEQNLLDEPSKRHPAGQPRRHQCRTTRRVRCEVTSRHRARCNAGQNLLDGWLGHLLL